MTLKTKLDSPELPPRKVHIMEKERVRESEDGILDFEEDFPMNMESKKYIGNVHEDDHGDFWRILWYPQGNDADGYVSCYLEWHGNRDDVKEAVHVEFGISILHREDMEKSLVSLKGEYHSFSKMQVDWGYREFQSIDVLRKDGFRDENDFVTLQVVIKHVDAMECGRDWSCYDSKKETGMVGLKNQGATCYMNSLLQTLYLIPKFRRFVYDLPTQEDDTITSVSLALQRVFYRLQIWKHAVSTKELTKSFGWGDMEAFTQHDVQELYRILCDRLEEKTKACKTSNFIQEMFEGKVRSFITCVKVDYTSARAEPFYDLQLDVKGCKDLYESFDQYTKVEMLDGENQYFAEQFGKQDAKKGLQFLCFPPILNIQLKRFEYDPMRNGMVKVHDRFEFPQELKLDQYVKEDAQGYTYYLHSVLIHSGDVHGGHYYVFSRPSNDPYSKEWFRFDDERIIKVDASLAIEDSFGNVKTRIVSPKDSPTNADSLLPEVVPNISSAYMLVYVRKCFFDEYMQTIADDQIPKSLVDRFQVEETLAIEARKQRELEHLYLTIRIVTDSCIMKVCPLQHIKKTTDFIPTKLARKLKVERASTFAGIMTTIQNKWGIPITRQRLWTMVLRENKTFRPDSPIASTEMLTWTIGNMQQHELQTIKGSFMFYLEVIPECSSHQIFSGLKLDVLDDSSDSSDRGEDENANVQITIENLKQFALIRDTPECPADSWILLFVKFYDPTLDLDDANRLAYTGNILIQKTQTGHDLEMEIRKFTKNWLDSDKELLLFEEIEPMSVQTLEKNVTLLHSELQSGDIICFQYQNEDSFKFKFPFVPNYFKYLLSRVAVTFYLKQDQRNHPTTDELDTEFTLELSTQQSYNEVVEAVAKHLKMDNPLYVRLYQHNSITGRAKSRPLAHAIFAHSSSGNTLEDLLVDYAERYTTLYYEKLEHSIVDIEANRCVNVQLVEFVEESGKNISVDAKPSLSSISSILISKTDNIDALLSSAYDTFNIPKSTQLRICHISSNPQETGCSILHSYEPGEDLIYKDDQSTSSNLFYVYKMSSAEILARQKSPHTIRTISVFHFHLKPNNEVEKHSIPFMLFVKTEDTILDVRNRIQAM